MSVGGVLRLDGAAYNAARIDGFLVVFSFMSYVIVDFLAESTWAPWRLPEGQMTDRASNSGQTKLISSSLERPHLSIGFQL